MIEVELAKARGDFRLDIAFCAMGGITALFGPSGSGKSSVIRLLSGLDRPDKGRIVVEGRVLCDTQARVHLPPHRRRVGVVFQESLLFPHFSVIGNLRYGRNFTPRGERTISEGPVIETLGIGHLLRRHPATLSGGERQRVAIGRALLSSPKLLLMDEPLASLDWSRRQEILPLIERLRDEFRIPIVYVSHAAEEVARLAEHVVIFDRGRVQRAGTPADVLHTTGGSDGDRFQMASVLEGTLGAPDAAYGLTPVEHPAGRLWLSGIVTPVGRKVRVVVRGVDVALATERPSGLSIRTVLSARIAAIEATDAPSATVELALSGGNALSVSLTRRSIDDLGLMIGRDVFALVKSVAIDQRPI